MVKVTLHGLKIARAKGKYYVYVRSTGETLLKGFEGDKAALLLRLAMPDMIGSYNSKRKRDPKSYPEKTLGWLVDWYVNDCPDFKELAELTQKQYRSAYLYLEPEFDIPLTEITQSALYSVRDKCSANKWPRFADQMITALGSMFKRAIKRDKMANNPARGMDRAHKYDPNANREWLPDEWTAAIAVAPLKFKIAMMIARYLGYRGQSIAKLQWSNYQTDPVYGKCFRMAHKKNDVKQHWLPAEPPLQKFLDGLERPCLHIATKEDGVPWKNEAQLQIGFSNWIASIEKRGIVGEGCTLHGLRGTFASDKKRQHGANDSAVAAALGDKSDRMGAHYTRHVENEIKVIQAFGRPAGKKKKRT